MYTCIPNCKKMQKTQHISHRAMKVPCAFCFCIDGLVYFHCFYRCYDIRLCVHITRNCSSLHLFCCVFFPLFHLNPLARSLPPILVSYYCVYCCCYFLRFTISFSDDFVRSGLFYAYFTFPSREKKCFSF